MKTFLSLVFLSLLSASAMAGGGLYKGQTPKGSECSVNFSSDLSNVVFASGSHAFGFGFSEEALQQALQTGQGRTTLKGGDGPTKAKLELSFNPDSSPSEAVYTEWLLIISSKIQCLQLKKSN